MSGQRIIGKIHFGDNLEWLLETSKEKTKAQLIYIDPPFSTGEEQRRGNLAYQDNVVGRQWFNFTSRLLHAYDILSSDGSILMGKCDCACHEYGGSCKSCDLLDVSAGPIFTFRSFIFERILMSRWLYLITMYVFGRKFQ